ncbi:MAG: class I SAM-dependent methyltransferase [Actinomycetia bacterium]|nr:class I SAM-dependent methyltransferase [Actinomycetes bacterium]MCP3913641.1 class I SAM-dependent methyltransferase [Actinomycetes bacterium]MCP4086254.1 class I SAM-dependent methyltransferase [Actinomycetes bacterium]
MSGHFDRARAKAFAGTMTDVMNGGALALMCSIGHRTGLFDAMATMEAATADEVAAESELHPRYVKEWLSAMTMGGIIDHDVESETFHLPPEHAGLLTRAAGPLNLTTFCQYIGLLGEVEDDVVEAFRNGGGVPYDRYPKFTGLMDESSGQRYHHTLIDQVVPLLGGAEQFESGIDVADVGCGSGLALSILGSAYPNSRFVGYDFGEQGVAAARARTAEAGLTNVDFEVRDAAELGEVDRFDLVTTFDAIHDQARPREVLSGINRALRPGGTYLCVEPKASSCLHENHDLPMAPLVYTISTMHCMTVSMAYGGPGLGTAWGEGMAMEWLGDAGFVDIESSGIRDDRGNSYFLSRKAGS